MLNANAVNRFMLVTGMDFSDYPSDPSLHDDSYVLDENSVQKQILLPQHDKHKYNKSLGMVLKPDLRLKIRRLCNQPPLRYRKPKSDSRLTSLHGKRHTD